MKVSPSSTNYPSAIPGTPRILNLTGLALTGKGEIEQADQTFLRCLTENPDFLPALKNLGINEYRQHHLPSAEGYLSKALLLSPTDPVIQLHLGLLAFDRQDFRRAYEMLTPAKDLVLRDPNATAELGASALQTGDLATGESLLSHVPPDRLNLSMQLQLSLALGSRQPFQSGTSLPCKVRRLRRLTRRW